ncbi:MAG: response regulator transcription factor [Candidatus Acidiferrales bacterium]|jgi:DNA-binding NarL/FixJ family response regulator
MSGSGATTVSQLDRRVRILIVDDHPIIRRVVRSTLQRHPHFDVCGEAVNGAEAIAEAKKLKPDVVVLNVSMPVMNGLDAAREIKMILPESAIVILSQNADRHFIAEAKSLGVQAYVVKTKAGESLVKAVEGAVLGEDFFFIE